MSNGWPITSRSWTAGASWRTGRPPSSRVPAPHGSGSDSRRPSRTATALALVAALAPGRGATLVAAGTGAHYELSGLADAPDPRLVAALAGWCAERGLLITELRLGAASLEERYLELVGTDVATETEGAA